MSARMILGGVVVALAHGAAGAGLVVLNLQNGNDGGGPFNTTEFQITNISEPGVALTSFSLTVGDTQFLFDEIYLSRELFVGGNGTEAATLTVGDRAQDGLGGDSFSYDFVNFNPNVGFRGQWDIDFDNGVFDVDARTVLFNNGAAPNAVASFAFSDGSSIEFTFPDDEIRASYTLTIPAPGAAVLGAMGGLVALRRRR